MTVPINTTSIFTSQSKRAVEMTLPLGSLGWENQRLSTK
jgi:hypothetical protein